MNEYSQVEPPNRQLYRGDQGKGRAKGEFEAFSFQTTKWCCCYKKEQRGTVQEEDDEFILDMLFEVSVGHQGDTIWKEVCNTGLNCRNNSGLEILIQELVVLGNSEAKGTGVFIQGAEGIKELGQNKQRTGM